MINDHIQHRPVGFKSPPRQHTFKKGHKGMGGRPRKQTPVEIDPTDTTKMDRLILAEANRPVQVKENGKVTKLPALHAMMRIETQLAMDKEKGQQARARVIKSTQAAQAREQQRQMHTVSVYQGYKDRCAAKYAECDKLGVERPDFHPHPDDFQIDAAGTKVIINGPITDEDQAEWDSQVAYREQLRWDREQFFPRLDDYRREQGFFDDNDVETSGLNDDLTPEEREDHSHMLLDILDIKYPPEAVRRTPGFDLDKHREKMINAIPPLLRKRIKRAAKRAAALTDWAPPPAAEPSLFQRFLAMELAQGNEVLLEKHFGPKDTWPEPAPFPWRIP